MLNPPNAPTLAMLYPPNAPTLPMLNPPNAPTLPMLFPPPNALMQTSALSPGVDKSRTGATYCRFPSHNLFSCLIDITSLLFAENTYTLSTVLISPD